jgi:excisionase family DNA binding protein
MVVRTKSLTKSAHHHQLLKGVDAAENGDVTLASSALPPIRAGPAVAKPLVAYTIQEAARAAAIGVTKLRTEIRAGRLRARKVGRRTIITHEDLEFWAAGLPKVHDVAATVVGDAPSC